MSNRSTSERPSFVADGQLKHAVAGTVAEELGTDRETLPPPDSIDLDALDHLFASSADGDGASEMAAEFEYGDFYVTVDQRTGVLVSDSRSSGEEC